MNFSFNLIRYPIPQIDLIGEKVFFILTDPVIYWELKTAINQAITRPLETLSTFKKVAGNGKKLPGNFLNAGKIVRHV